MNIKKDFFKAALLVIVLSFLYYLFYAWNANTLSAQCDKYICFQILSLAEFLALLMAWISLYFILKSLTSWKESYKFERAMTAIQKINELKLLADRYYVFLNQLSNQLQRLNEFELKGSFHAEEHEFYNNVNQLNISYHQIELELWLEEDRNIQHYSNFKRLFEQFFNMMSNVETTVNKANLSEPNYGSRYATQSDIARRKVSIKDIQTSLNQFKLDKYKFQESVREVHNKLNNRN